MLNIYALSNDYDFIIELQELVFHLTTDFEHFFGLQLSFELLSTEVLSYDVTKAIIDLVELLMGGLHIQSRGLQRAQDFDDGLI